MTFKDNFSKQAEFYAKYRPVYPTELFTFLSSLAPEHELAWDCGTGNGQCAVELSGLFEKVFASDPSEKQIQHALRRDNINYKIESGEKSSLKNNSADLITVAQALHWMDTNLFFEEAKRVMKNNAVICVISYVNPVVSKEIDKITDHLHDNILKGYWQPENQLVFEGYRSIPFPFEEFKAPEFRIEKELSSSDFLGHLRTWSAVQRYIDAKSINPLTDIKKDLLKQWKEGETKKVTWKLNLKIGKKNQSNS